MRILIAAVAVVIAVTGSMKGRTGYAVSRRQSLVECPKSRDLSARGCNPKLWTESKVCGWQCAGIGGVYDVDGRGAGHAAFQ